MSPVVRGWEGLPSLSQTLYQDTYFLEGETYYEWVERISSAYTNDDSHQERIASYLTQYWFHPATPISSNGGTDRGLPISCFVREVEDSKEGIFYSYNEGFWLGARGTGIGTTWDTVREVGSKVGDIGTSSGVIPFIGISDRATLAISQGGLRRASESVYLSVSHPEITEFIEMRKPDKDPNRSNQNIDHGILISDAFMAAVEARASWNLISRKTGEVVDTVDAFDLWTSILDVRTRLKGEPFIIFIDRMNELAPEEYKILNKEIKLSNLCTEIALNTEADKANVCVLSSLNLEFWDEYEGQLQQVVSDIIDFLDNVVQDFIDSTEGLPGFERARKGAIEERPLGLGVMGFHTLLQKKHLPWESAPATGLNLQIFQRLREATDSHQESLGEQCPMSEEADTMKRNIVSLAVAPTMSISNLCNVTSSGVEPQLANAYTKKLKQGSFPIRNKFLEAKLREYFEANKDSILEHNPTKWVEAQWTSLDQSSIHSSC